jgi:signal peptidase I
MPITGGKSYIEWPQWPYERVKGLGNVQLNDIVVFNYPTGDTIVSNPRFAANDFYKMVSDISVELNQGRYPVVDSLTAAEERVVYDKFLAKGRKYIAAHPEVFGKVGWRPVDRRENYVKRCVGLPGQTLEIKDKVIYLDGVANKEPDNVQYSYYVATKRPIGEKLRREAGISKEDLANHNANSSLYLLPLTQQAVEVLNRHTEVVDSITPIIEEQGQGLYPVNKHTGWSVDNYGPLWIPKCGETIVLTLENLPFYERPIAVYEGNDLQVRDGRIYINGKETTEYTFTMDYYWMQGDNRHNSLDSRFWGFVPEDHIVGKPILIWLSLDKDRGWFDGKIRWNRMFRMVEDYK